MAAATSAATSTRFAASTCAFGYYPVTGLRIEPKNIWADIPPCRSTEPARLTESRFRRLPQRNFEPRAELRVRDSGKPPSADTEIRAQIEMSARSRLHYPPPGRVHNQPPPFSVRGKREFRFMRTVCQDAGLGTVARVPD